MDDMDDQYDGPGHRPYAKNEPLLHSALDYLDLEA